MTDPVQDDFIDYMEFDVGWGVAERNIPKLVALELRRQFEKFDDPSRYDLILRARELEQL